MQTFEFDSDWNEFLRIAVQDRANVEIVSPAIDSGLIKAWTQSHQEDPDCEFSTELEFISDAFIVSIKQKLAEANLVVIDGGPRNLAMIAASKFARSSTMVIVDNSDRDGLYQGITALRKAGFTEIPMRGLGPLNHYEWTTSFFIRDLETIRSYS